MFTEFLRRNIRRLRLEKGLTQEALAERVGVSSKTVSKWETGGSEPNVEQLVSLARAFGVTTDALLLSVRAEKGDLPQTREAEQLRLLRETYGVTARMLAGAADVTEREAAAFLSGALLPGPSAEIEAKAARRLTAAANLLANVIPLYAAQPAALLPELLARLETDDGLSRRAVEAYAGLAPGRLDAVPLAGGGLTAAEEKRLLTALFLLDRALNPADPYPVDRLSTRTSRAFRPLLLLGERTLRETQERGPGLPAAQVTVLEGLSGRLYTAVNDVDGAVCAKLEAAGETGLCRLVTLWSDGSLDLPAQALMAALLRWQPACGEAEILLDTAGSGARLRLRLKNAARPPEG